MAWGMRNVVISLFGSSIMEGRVDVENVDDRYYMILQKMLSHRFPEVCFSIINSSVGGWSTRELMKHLDDYVLKYSPDYCVVMFGANNHDHSHPERILAEGEFERLMDEFEARLPERCHRIGAVCNPIVDENHKYVKSKDPVWIEALKPYGNSLDRLMEPERESARRFYREHGYPIVDLGTLMRPDPARYLLAEDGIHHGPAGHRLFAEALFQVLEQMIIANGDDTNGR